MSELRFCFAVADAEPLLPLLAMDRPRDTRIAARRRC
jgi:hypothetical protein